MKTILLFSLLMIVISGVDAQDLYVWKGGQPGHENDWECAANWNTNRVPGASADVVIPGSTSHSSGYPVLSSSGAEVNSLRISCGAKMTIAATGSLSILNPDYCDDISRIILYGKLLLPGRSISDQETVLAGQL